MSRWLFAALTAMNLAALGLLFVLGLAAAKPSHTPMLSVLGFFLVPAAVLAGVVWLYWRSPWPGAKALAFGLTALPPLVLVGGALFSSGAAWRAGLAPGTADRWGQPDLAQQQRLEAAIKAQDAPAVDRIVSDPQRRLDDRAALAAALRQIEQDPQQIAVLRRLLAAGVKPNAGGAGEAALATAIRISRSTGAEPVRLLLQAGADPNLRSASGPAWFAALSPRTDPAVLPALLERGADLHAVDMAGSGALHWAAQHLNWSATALLVERGAEWQAYRSPDGQGLRQLVDQQRRRHPQDPALARLDRLLRPSR
jgi:hypothetical protein